MSKFKCKPNCADCCGPIPFKDSFIQRYQDFIQVEPLDFEIISKTEVVPLCPDGSCLFLDRENLKCAIYEHRPQVCRDYGLSEYLPCCWFKPNGNPRNEAQRKRLLRQLRKEMGLKK